MSEKLVLVKPPEWDYDVNRVIRFSIDSKLLRDPGSLFIFEKLFSLGMVPLSIQNGDFMSRDMTYICYHKYFPKIPEGGIVPDYEVIIYGEERSMVVDAQISGVNKIILRPKNGGTDIIAYHTEVV